jgi:hypothetical protein
MVAGAAIKQKCLKQAAPTMARLLRVATDALKTLLVAMAAMIAARDAFLAVIGVTAMILIVVRSCS